MNNNQFQGAMLSDVDIKNELQKGENADLMIQNFEEDCLTPVGYDARAGETYFSLKRKRVSSLTMGEFELKPGDTVFISSHETFKLSPHVGGFGVSRLRPMLDNILLTALPIDPTWNGKLLIILTNLGKKSFVIRYKDRLMTLCFIRMQTPSQKQVARERWNNENILQRFREMEKGVIHLKRKLIFIDCAVLIGTLVTMIALWRFGLISDFVSMLSLTIAAIAIYFSSIRRQLE